MISRELLGEVLREKISFIYKEVDNYNRIHYVSNNCACRLNIYELAHKCKEWAIIHEYMVQSELEGLTPNKKPYGIVRIFFDGDIVWNNYDSYVEYQTEPEAIFKACQWILENKDKK